MRVTVALVSEHGRNLVVLVVGGLVIGYLLAFVTLYGAPLYAYFLQENDAVYHGWFWQLFTSIIVAPPGVEGIIDVAFNAVALLWLDKLFSAFYTPRQYYGTFLASAVFGNLISLLSGPNVASFGASGGIFGLVAGMVSYDYAVNRKLSFALLSWFLLIFVASSFLTPGVDWLAHGGGSFLGLVIGYWIGSKRGIPTYSL
jgi:membrane associated rhomboid family serine protease